MSDTNLNEDDVLNIDDITEDNADLSAIEGDLNEIEEEQEKLKAIQNEMVGHMNLNTSSQSDSTQSLLTPEEKAEADAKSVYVGNVDYGATAEEIEQHFHGCGSVARVTILCDKFSRHPKGFAYVEFTEKDGMQNALAMTDSLLRGRQIKVDQKRANRPGLSTTNRPPFRGRGGTNNRKSTTLNEMRAAQGEAPPIPSMAPRGDLLHANPFANASKSDEIKKEEVDSPPNSPPAPQSATKTTLHKAQQKAASERARMQSYQQPSAPGIHSMNNRRKDVQKKFDSLLQNNGLVGQFTAPTKDTVKKWRADPFAGLKSPPPSISNLFTFFFPFSFTKKK
ncbi:hypothetical protein CAEBREN_16301 [Caenorhabditis brenneri]|uniref:RRM domain-containing protein n=1 Tax=Caenorhabditis brenneri TaxID=135651 RepID=G0NGB2_CAEBE|nr:hypothetical protein CAEBREN_16301 [Caenorhabditis brenneri]